VKIFISEVAVFPLLHQNRHENSITMKNTLRLLSYLTMLLLISFAGYASDDNFQLSYTDNQFLEIEFRLPEYNINANTTPEGKFTFIEAEHAAVMLEAGNPDLPFYAVSIQIPKTGNFELEIISYETETLNVEHPVAPSKGNLMRSTDPATIPFTMGEVYAQNEDFPKSQIMAGEDFMIRDLRGIPVKVYPFSYNPGEGKITIYKKLKFRLTLTNAGFDDLRQDGKMVPLPFHNMYSRLFLNYENHTDYDPLSEEGNMLIICHDAWLDEMAELVEWKIQSGIPTEIVGTSVSGSTPGTIKSYVDTYYNTHGLTFLLFVGDSDEIPPREIGLGGPSDLGYGYIVGNDHYPDIIVGRFSAESANDVATQVERTIAYEKGLFEETAWIDKTMGIASQQGPGDDNEFDYQHIRNLQDELLDFKYANPPFEFFDGSQGGYDAPNNPSAAMVIEGLDDGAGVVWYCGHGVTTGWSTSYFDSGDLMQLENQGKLPFVVSTACLVGNFIGDSSCFGETWLRARKEGEPIGGVAAFMSTINQPWNPPMQAQDEMVEIITESIPGNIKHTYGGVMVNGCYSMNEVYGDPANDVTDTWVIFGDPSLLIRTDTPVEITAGYPQYILESTTEITVTSNKEGTKVVASYNNEILGTAIISGGQAVVPLQNLPLGDNIKLTLTGYNGIPHEGSVLVTTQEPLIIFDNCLINGEENLEYNQTANVDITLLNVGLSDATAVSATLTTEDEYIVSLSNNQNISFGAMSGSGGSSTSSGSFTVEVSSEVPDLHEAIFNLEISDGTNTWSHTLSIIIHAPNLEFSVVEVHDDCLSPIFTSQPEQTVAPGEYYEYNIEVAQNAGNGDGNLDAGDSADIHVMITNSGHAEISNIPLTIQNNSTYVTFQNTQATIDILAAGETNPAIFTAQVNDDCPPGEVVEFVVNNNAGFYGGSQNFAMVSGKVDDTFETNDFHTIEWQFSGNPWDIENTGFESEYAAASPEIGNSEQTELYTTINPAVDDFISFDVKVSSEADADEFVFTMDGTEIVVLSGEIGWQHISVPVSAGQHTLKWIYRKDFIFVSGDDKVWIDNISLPPFQNPHNNIRITSNTLPDWLSLDDHFNGSATLSGTAPGYWQAYWMEIQATQMQQISQQQFNLDVGFVNISTLTMTQFDVYPNPFTTEISIETGHAEGFTLVVNDLNGKLIFLHTYPGGKSTIDLNNLPTGTYIFKVISKGKTLERKIIKI
jgi:hypothetical protein